MPPTRRDTDITAGVPGLGLSGLFVLLSALALPLARRRRVPWVRVRRLFGLAAIMAAAIILTWEVIVEAVTTTATATAGSAHPLSGGIVIHGSVRVPIILISASIMVLVIAIGAALLRLVGARLTPTPPPVEASLPPEPMGWRAPPAPSPRHARPGKPLAVVTCHETSGAGLHRPCP